MTSDVLAICDHLISKGAIAFEVSIGDTSVKANLAEPFKPADAFLVEQADDESVAAAHRKLEEALYFNPRSEKP